jgi:hypothetical protein
MYTVLLSVDLCREPLEGDLLMVAFFRCLPMSHLPEKVQSAEVAVAAPEIRMPEGTGVPVSQM